MRTNDFPYGKITKTLRNATKWLNSNRCKLEKTKCEYSFDYPDYWNMPKIISSRLSGDEVDWLQNEVGNWDFKLSEEEYYSEEELAERTKNAFLSLINAHHSRMQEKRRAK